MALHRRSLCLALAAAPCVLRAADDFEGDPFKSHPWPQMRREFLGAGARVVFDERVQVQGPAFAEDPMNVPISVRVDPALGPVEEIVVLVDRNPIRKVLSYLPLQALPALAFRFKLEQASPVRAIARTRDGLWHAGGTWVDSAGGGCTVAGATRKDGSWSQTLGEVTGRLYSSAPGSTAVSPAGGAGGVKVGSTKGSVPVPYFSTSTCPVAAGPKSRTAFSHAPIASP